MTFTDVTVAAGQVVSIRQHDTATLEPAAVAICARLLASGARTFPVPAPPDLGAITCTVAESPTHALVDFAVDGVLYTRSALLRDAASVAPAWCAATLPAARPLLATLVVASASGSAAAVAGWNPDAMAMIADMETCLAAAYFLAHEATP